MSGFLNIVGAMGALIMLLGLLVFAELELFYHKARGHEVKYYQEEHEIADATWCVTCGKQIGI